MFPIFKNVQIVVSSSCKSGLREATARAPERNMSFFMTIAGATSEMSAIVGIELVAVEDAQDYIKSLAAELSRLDGIPVYLVHDCETGTSDLIVADLENALSEGVDRSYLPGAQVLQACFDNRVSFRIWWADNDPNAHINNTMQVSDLAEAFAAIKSGRGATWTGSQHPQISAGNGRCQDLK